MAPDKGQREGKRVAGWSREFGIPTRRRRFGKEGGRERSFKQRPLRGGPFITVTSGDQGCGQAG